MAIALVVSTAENLNSSGATTNVIDTTGANAIVIAVSSYNQVTTVSDNKSNTWTKLTTRNSSTQLVCLYYCLNPTVGSGHTFTCSAATTYSSIAVQAFSGVASYDKEAGAGGSGTSLATGSVTPATSGSVLVSGIGLNAGVTSLAVNNSLTLTDQLNYVSGYSMGIAIAYYVQPSAGAINPTWSWTNSATAAAAILVLAPSGGPINDSVAENLGLGDAPGSSGSTFYSLTADGVSITCVSSWLSYLLEAIAEGVSVDDSAALSWWITLLINEGMSADDVAVLTYILGCITNEGLGFYDQPKVGWSVVVADVLAAADVARLIFGPTVDEWLILADTLTDNWRGVESLSESVILSDYLAVRKQLTDTLADAVAVTDSLALILSISVLDNLFLNILVACRGHQTEAVADTWNILDYLQKSFDQLIADALAATDTTMATWLLMVSIADMLTATDAGSSRLTMTCPATDTLSLVDAQTVRQTLQNLIQDRLSFEFTLTLGGDVYQCWALTGGAFAPSVYSNFGFNSFAVFQGQAYGAKSGGVYSIGGTSDAGSVIHPGVVLTATNLGTEGQKRFSKAYFGLSGSVPALKVVADDGTAQIFAVTGRAAHVSRSLKGKDWTFSLSDFDTLDFVELFAVVLTRE